MDKDSPAITNDLIEKYGIPTMSVEDYEKLAKKNNEPEKVIINLDWNNGGTHWVACKTDQNNTIHYYDPFGICPPFKNIKRNVIWNRIKDQEMNQSNCGWRSLASLL
jgi:hypothetical protein